MLLATLAPPPPPPLRPPSITSATPFHDPYYWPNCGRASETRSLLKMGSSPSSSITTDLASSSWDLQTRSCGVPWSGESKPNLKGLGSQ